MLSEYEYNFFLNILLLCLSPKSLELTAANESILIDNEEVFRKNGFTFKIDHNGTIYGL